MAGDDLKVHAQSAEQDFYELLGVSESATETEIPRAYRKTALKYHPDKVGANQEALDKFHLVQIAYDVLSDSSLRGLYDNARRARAEKKARDDALHGHRRRMKEDLERRESDALKRKRETTREEAAFNAELQRLAEDGKRRRKEFEDRLHRETLEAQHDRQPRADINLTNNHDPGKSTAEVPEVDRSIILRYHKSAENEKISKEDLQASFERFGPIDGVILKEKKVKVDGEKHRRLFVTVLLVFRTIVGAHALVSDFEAAREADPETFGKFEQVGWLGGKEPDCIPKAPVPIASPARGAPIPAAEAPSTPKSKSTDGEPGLKKMPSFASFKGGTPRSAGPGTPSSHDITMIRLKNAERRRLEEKIRAEEAAIASNDPVS